MGRSTVEVDMAMRGNEMHRLFVLRAWMGMGVSEAEQKLAS